MSTNTLIFTATEHGQAMHAKVKAFIETQIEPIEAKFWQDCHEQNPDGNWRNWQWPEKYESLRKQAREAGLWNLFLPDDTLGAGLSVTDYAPIAELTGRSLLAPYVFNCNAPDSGNMELLWRYGSEEQQAKWLMPILEGKTRSVFCMTEPDVASSDATNMQATAVVDGDEIIINGSKWWSSGLGDPAVDVLIVMAYTPDQNKDRHHQHSMVLVPAKTSGVNIERMLKVFGDYDAPHGHGEVSFNDVRVPVSHFIGGAGMGFEIAQGRLGPGRIHHCMRAIGVAERALDLMIDRAQSRVTFGEPVANRANIMDWVAESRIEIEMARLLTLKAAHMMDTVGNKVARTEIAAIKVAAPAVALKVIDRAIQVHGGGGVSDDFPLALWYAHMRTLRLADGPDEVHKMTIARREYRRRDPEWGRNK